MLSKSKAPILFSNLRQQLATMTSDDENLTYDHAILERDMNCPRDLTIRASCGDLFSVHRAVLFRRSRVFATLFTDETVDYVELEDTDGRILRLLISYLYSSSVKMIDLKNLELDLLVELFIFADRYRFQRLRYAFERALAGRVDLDNAVDLAQIADRHDAKILRQEAMLFLYRYAKNIYDSDRRILAKLVDKLPTSEMLELWDRLAEEAAIRKEERKRKEEERQRKLEMRLRKLQLLQQKD